MPRSKLGMSIRNWLLTKSVGVYVFQCGTHCLTFNADTMCILDTDPRNPVPISVTPESIEMLGVTEDVDIIYEIVTKRKKSVVK